MVAQPSTAKTAATDSTSALDHQSPAPELDAPRFAAQLDALTRARIVEALEKTGGNQTAAAKLLGTARGTLIAQLDAHQLPRPRKRSPRAPSSEAGGKRRR
jgi:transcriptional regulator with GAF, ATPase, and Fis domain